MKQFIFYHHFNDQSMSLKCDLCGTTFSSESEMKEHGKMHGERGPDTDPKYACACGESFQDENELKLHASEAHGL